jgi:hypothetical protein
VESNCRLIETSESTEMLLQYLNIDYSNYTIIAPLLYTNRQCAYVGSGKCGKGNTRCIPNDVEIFEREMLIERGSNVATVYVNVPTPTSCICTTL